MPQAAQRRTGAPQRVAAREPATVQVLYPAPNAAGAQLRRGVRRLRKLGLKLPWMVATFLFTALLAVVTGMLLFGRRAGPPEPVAATQPPAEYIATLESKVQALESRLAESEQRAAARQDQLQARLDDLDELPLLREAGELGIARELALAGRALAPREEQRVAAAIVREAKRNGLDPRLVAAVIRVESTWNPRAVSNVGAIGLMQVMPDTAEWMSVKQDVALRSKKHLFDAETNIAFGARYLAELVKRFGSVEKALLAYNMGPSNARKVVASKNLRKALAGYPRAVITQWKRLKKGETGAVRLARR